MKGLSAFALLLAVSFVFNAIDDQWAFKFSDKGGKWVALDLVLAGACLLASLLLWNAAKRRELRELIRQHGYPDALDHFDPSE